MTDKFFRGKRAAVIFCAVMIAAVLTGTAGCGRKYGEISLTGETEQTVEETEQAENEDLMLEDADGIQEEENQAVADLSGVESELSRATGFSDAGAADASSAEEPPAAETEQQVPAASNGIIVAIDAGHQAKGNSEKEPIGPGSSTMKAKVAAGATGVVTKLPEYQLTLDVSEKVKRILEERGYQVVMIRETNDVNMSNAERAEVANESGASIFVRIHANSLDSPTVHGTLSMCQTEDNPYNGSLHAQSYSLSKCITDAVCAATGFKNRGVQETDTMSGINWSNIPVTIVEMGFMSNPEEDQKMAQDEYQELIAAGIANGIDAYFGN